MPANKHARLLPSPWRELLAELDGMLHESLELHCIGGFVFTYFYGLPRTTGDIDYYTAIPANLNLDEVAGQGSALHTKHGVWLHRVAVANLPEDYASRLTEMTPGEFKYLKLLVPDPYDCILSKLERNAAKDRDDADYLFRARKLDAEILRDRYKNELRHNVIGNPEWHDKTLELWIEIFESQT
jgi:Nucleotidyltransferase of unknown function (DUF6036)